VHCGTALARAPAVDCQGIPSLVKEEEMVLTARLTIPAILLAGVAVSSEAQVSPVELIVSATIDHDSKQIVLDVTNSGARAATAWSLRVESDYPGRPAEIMVVTEDVYERLASAQNETDGLLAPGSPAQVKVGFPLEGTPTAVRVTPAAVVYDDRSAHGDPNQIDKIFARRMQDLRSTREVLLELRAFVKAGSSLASARTLSEDFRSRSLSMAGESKRALAANNMRLIVVKGTQQPGTVAQDTLNLLKMFERLEAVATQHSRRP
jgi:hypothetical protein